MAVAAELVVAELEEEAARLTDLRNRLEQGIVALVPDAVVNGGGADRLPHILNITIPGADQESLLIGLDLEGVAASGASACQTGTAEPSHVLVAMGRTMPNSATVRFSLGHTTTAQEIAGALPIVARVAGRVRLAVPA
jgi:cysteine desulfurase